MIFIVPALFLTAAAAAFFFILFIREKKRSKASQKKLVDIFADITEVLTKFSFGIINTRMQLVQADNISGPLEEPLKRIEDKFNQITDESLERVCYVGTDAWFEGIACARHIGEKLKNGGKIVIVVTSSLKALIMIQRHRSFVQTLKDEFPKIKIVETFEALADFERARKYASSKAADVDGIYITGNSAVLGVCQGLADAGKHHKIFVLCHDLDETIVSNMRSGLVSASIVCSTYAQGRDSVIHAFNAASSGWKPSQPRLMQDLRTVTVENLAEYWDDFKKEPNKKADIHQTGVFPIPPKNKSKKIRILVLCEDWNTAFRQMREGSLSAAEELKAFQCETVIYTLNQVKKGEKDVVSEARSVIEREKKIGLDAVTAFVGIHVMVPLLNSYSSQGILVTTFNSEPLNLRSMIQWLILSTSVLNDFSHQYNSIIQRINTQQEIVLKLLSAIVERSSEQVAFAQAGREYVSSLTGIIQTTSDMETQQVASVSTTEKATADLSQLVSFLNGRITGLQDMGEQVRKSASKTDAINKYSEKIESIISIIDSISEKTNLLAFNAAIESSHAGEWGKGFKVISQEIRELADKSVESTRGISRLISDMKQAVQEGISANTITLTIVKDQVESITKAAGQLDSLTHNLLNSVDSVRTVTAKNAQNLKIMRDTASGISSVMEDTHERAVNNKTTIDSVNNSFSDMKKNYEIMNKQTEKLSELITIMQGTVSSFYAK